MPRARTGHRSALALLLALACWISLAPRARATPLASLWLHHVLWASPNAAEPTPQRTPSSPVGTLPGTFTVDDDGAARYEIPLSVPPAARGLEPDLSLVYDSHAGNGPLGVGWSLTGQSALSRCALELADDGRVAPVGMTDADALCLDGARLLLISGNPFDPGAIYRPKRDNFSRIRVVSSADADGNGCHGGFGFEVDRRDGTIATYGCTRDASVTNHLGAHAWALSRLRDRFGNVLEYRYAFETEPVTDAGGQWLGEADVEHRLAGIDYGAHTWLHGSTRSIALEWEPRPDVWEGWSHGAPQRQSQRLAGITTSANGAVVTRYLLEYDTPSITGRSLLTNVRHCDAAGVCKPATTLEWETGQLGFTPVPELRNFADIQPFPYMAMHGDLDAQDPYVLDSALLDADGDGRTDLLLAVGDDDYSIPNNRGWELWTSQPGADSAPSVLPCATSEPEFELCRELGRYVVHEAARTSPLPFANYANLGQAEPPMFAGDYDGDGRDDAIALGDPYFSNGSVPPAGRNFLIVRALPEGGVEQFEFDPTNNEIIWWFTANDQTGDGLGDLLYCAGPAEPHVGVGHWYLLPNEPGVGFAAQNVIDTGVTCSAYDKLLLLDHDGDGIASLLVIPTWDDVHEQRIPSAQWSNYHALSFDHAWHGTLVDTGLPPDYAQRWRPLIQDYNLSFLDADFPESQQGFGVDRILDVDADGLPDILRYELLSGDDVAQLDTIKATLVTQDIPEWGGVRLWHNTGAGFRPGAFVLESPAPGDHFFRRFLASAELDYDGDGRLDWLTPVDDPHDDVWDWSVFVSRGTDGFEHHANVFEFPVLDITTRARSLSTVDLDGDALHDFALLYPLSWSLREHPGRVPDKLVRIENGLGAWIEVGYRSLTDFEAPADFFAQDLDDCAYPQRCEREPRVVVEWYRVDDGLGLDDGAGREFLHRYGTARSDREARHGLGFEFHETIELDEQDRPIVRRHVGYAHAYDAQLRAFPHAGVPSTILVDQRDPETGRHVVTHVRRHFDLHSTSPLTFYPYISQQISRSYELESCAETFCEVADFDDASLTRDFVDTLHEIDAFGNPRIRTTAIDTGSDLITYRYETDYLNDAQTWLLGLPIHQREFFIELGGDIRERDVTTVYDPATGAPTSQIREPTEPELFLHTSFVHDAHGNLTSYASIDGNGEPRSSAVTYDVHGVFPITGTNALAQVSTITWDAGLGVPIEVVDPNNVRMVADHDGLGHFTGLRAYAGKFLRGDPTTITYKALAPNFDGAALEIRTTTAGHGYQVTHYDRLGRAIEQRVPALDGLRRDTKTGYDRYGRVVRISLPTPLGLLPEFERFEYDFADRQVRHELPDGTAETWAYAGLETTHVDLGGSTEVLIHDLAGRLIESTRAVGSPDEERMCFDYSAFELLERARPDCVIRTPLSFDGEAPPTVKTYEYDDLGRPIESDDPSEGPRSFVYNGYGDLKLYIDGNGNEVELFRDALGRVIERHDIDGITSWTWDVSFIGRLFASGSPSGHTEALEYDAFGRIESVTKTIAGEAFELSFDYDQQSRLAAIHYPEAPGLPAFWLRNIHADTGELIEVRSGPDDALLWRIEDIDARGRITLERFGSDAVTARSYDPLREFTRTIETTSHLGATLQSLEYGWNAGGTLDQREDLLHGQQETFAYDDLHRVRLATTHKGQQQHERHFAYDSLGNLVFDSDHGEYEYDQHGRLTTVDGSTHAWDDNGNLLTRVGARSVALTYTAFDKPETIDADGDLTELEYDAAQQRVYRYDHAESRETIYVDELYQRHHDHLTGETEHHYYVPGAERIVAAVVDHVEALDVARSVHYVHTDHLGSTDVVSDEAGDVVARMSFDVWGERRDAEDWTLPDEFAEFGGLNLGYTGHEAQLDGGLVNMGGRLYDPHLGRMASADPLVVAPTSTQGWNRYAYVLNNPLTLTDPSGFSPPDQTIEFEDADTVTGDVPTPAAPGNAQSGVMGGGEGTSNPQTGTVYGGETQAAQTGTSPGDQGPGATPRAMAKYTADHITEFVAQMPRVVTPVVQPPHPLEGFARAMTPPEGAYSEENRLSNQEDDYERFVANMQDPPAYAQAALWAATIWIGGEAELLGEAALLVGRGVAARQLAKEVGEEAVERAVVRRGGAAAVRTGQAGEAAVRGVADIGVKIPIFVAGRTRIPDGINLTTKVLTEVKNVKSLSYTQQLRDFAAYARANGLRFDLWVRSTTKLSGPLSREVANGNIVLRYIP